MSSSWLDDEQELRSGPGLKALAKWRPLCHKAIKWSDRMEVLRLAASLLYHFDSETGLHKQQIGASGRPAMMMYMNDGWSTFIWQVKAVLMAGHKVRTCQKLRREFLLERSILKSLQGARVDMSMLFGAPRPLTGRSAWDVFSALSEWQEPLRASSNGPIWNVYCWDGLLFSALRRLVFARHFLYYQTRPLLCVLFEQKCDRLPPFSNPTLRS